MLNVLTLGLGKLIEKIAPSIASLFKNIFNMMDETAKLSEKLGPKIAKAITSIDGDGALKQADEIIDALKGKGVSGEVIETVAEKKGLKGLQGYDDLLTKGVANETIEKLAKDGFDLDQVKELLDNGVHPDQYLEYGIKNSTEASWVNKFLKEGYALEDIKTLSKSGIDPSDYINKGITSPAIAKELAEVEANLPEYLSKLKGKPQVVINKEVGTAFEYYVEGTKLTHVDYDIQDLYGIIDKNTGDIVQVQPDFTLKSLTTGEKVAFADAKTALTGRIPYDNQFKRLVWLTQQETTTKTLIYYVPISGNYISDTMVAFADRYGVKILQVVAE